MKGRFLMFYDFLSLFNVLAPVLDKAWGIIEHQKSSFQNRLWHLLYVLYVIYFIHLSSSNVWGIYAWRVRGIWSWNGLLLMGSIDELFVMTSAVSWPPEISKIVIAQSDFPHQMTDNSWLSLWQNFIGRFTTVGCVNCRYQTPLCL